MSCMLQLRYFLCGGCRLWACHIAIYLLSAHSFAHARTPLRIFVFAVLADTVCIRTVAYSNLLWARRQLVLRRTDVIWANILSARAPWQGVWGSCFSIFPGTLVLLRVNMYSSYSFGLYVSLAAASLWGWDWDWCYPSMIVLIPLS